MLVRWEEFICPVMGIAFCAHDFYVVEPLGGAVTGSWLAGCLDVSRRGAWLRPIAPGLRSLGVRGPH